MAQGKYDIAEQIQDLLKEINQNLGYIWAKKLDVFPLTMHQIYIMKLIDKRAETNLTALCKELCVSKGSMSLTINRLHEEGYVSRKENASDRRNKSLYLTGKGERVLKETKMQSIGLLSEITSSLTERELEGIKNSLGKLNESIHLSTAEREK